MSKATKIEKISSKSSCCVFMVAPSNKNSITTTNTDGAILFIVNFKGTDYLKAKKAEFDRLGICQIINKNFY